MGHVLWPARAPSKLRVVDSAPKHKTCGPIRPSLNGRWRALSLVIVYILALLHILHWQLAGRTLTPVEPSEAMQTLGQGLVNAGFILLVLAVLSTLVLGRWFCGWACHIVALQDLCSWILKKLAIRPQPFRSRLVALVPVLAAAWMFVVPSVARAVMGAPAPALEAHFTTDSYWDRFPGIVIALLTFAVCGFLIVYVLGNKGFCTYACPYGGLFGPADRLAIGRIRVTDACEGCGHCTATCTSNVRVHEEVRLYGMVVDPGCMKCTDCISVCPKDALYYGFGRPALAKTLRAPRPARRYDYTWPEEIGLGLLFLLSIVTLTALYDHVPFLLALGLSAISAHALLTAIKCALNQDVRYARWQVRLRGSLTSAGRVFLAGAGIWTLFLVHSGFVHYLTFEGDRLLGHGQRLYDTSAGVLSAEALRDLKKSQRLLETASHLGLFDTAQHQARLASACSYLGDGVSAERHYGRALELAPGFAQGHREIARYASARGDREAAIRALKQAVSLEPDLPGAAGDLADLLLETSRGPEARAVLEGLIQRRPHDPELLITHALVLGQMGDAERALAEVQEVTARRPDHAKARYIEGRILANIGRYPEAYQALLRSAELDPRLTESRYWASAVAVRLGDLAGAEAHLDAALRLEPFTRTYATAWAAVVRTRGRLEAEIAAREENGPADRASRYRMVFLYKEAGRAADGEALLRELEPPGEGR